MPGYAEILQQHVARKNIGGRELLDGFAVIKQCVLGLRLAGVLQVDIERRHAPLGPAMTDQDNVTFFDHGSRCYLK